MTFQKGNFYVNGAFTEVAVSRTNFGRLNFIWNETKTTYTHLYSQ